MKIKAKASVSALFSLFISMLCCPALVNAYSVTVTNKGAQDATVTMVAEETDKCDLTFVVPAGQTITQENPSPCQSYCFTDFKATINPPPGSTKPVTVSATTFKIPWYSWLAGGIIGGGAYSLAKQHGAQCRNFTITLTQDSKTNKWSVSGVTTG
jgi:hypothetical protein